MLIRVRCKAGNFRYELQPSSNISELVEKIVKSVNAVPSSIKLSDQPRGGEKSVTELQGRTLAALGLQHGALLFVSYQEAVPETPQASSAPTGESTTTALHPPADATHRPWELVKEDAVDEHWRKQDGKIPRSRDTRFCKHGANAMCDYCMPLEPYDPTYHAEQGIKRLSYHAYIRKLSPPKSSPSASALLPPLEPLSYKVKNPCPNGKHAPWPAGICSSCQPSAITLQPQPFRMVDHLEFSTHEIVDRFLDVWRRTGTQRFGWLLGRYEPYDKVPMGIKAVVEAIHEPPQEGEVDGLTLGLPWEDESAVRALVAAAAPPLTIVGYIFTDLDPSEEDRTKNVYKRHPYSYYLSSLEVIFAARLQLQNPTPSRSSTTGMFSSRLVTAVATATEEGGIDINAYQVSEQACAMVDADMIEASVDPGIVRVKEEERTEGIGRYVPDVFFRYKNEYGLEVQKSAKPCFPVEYLLVNVTHGFPQNPSPLFISNKFPIENRPGLEDQDVQSILKELARLRAPEITSDSTFARKEPGMFHQLVEYISDWHLVSFLHTTGLVSEDDMKLLVRAASSASSEDPQAFYELFRTSSWETLMTFTRENAPSQPAPQQVNDADMDELPQEIRDQIAAMEAQASAGAGGSGVTPRGVRQSADPPNRALSFILEEHGEQGSSSSEVQTRVSGLEANPWGGPGVDLDEFLIWLRVHVILCAYCESLSSEQAAKHAQGCIAALEAQIALRERAHMRLDTMLATANSSPDLNINVNGNASANLKLDISSAAEQRVAESVSQELDYWEKLVFSFDMERDQGGPPPPDSGSNTRGRTKRRGEQRQTGERPSLSSGPPPSGSSASRSHGQQQPMDSRHLPNPSFPSHPPNLSGQMQNPQSAQLNQLAGLDPYTLAHLAALSAIQNGQHIPGSQPNAADPFAILRQVQGLLYPFGNANLGNGGQLQGMGQGFPQPQQQPSSSHLPSSGASRSSGSQQSAQNSLPESSGHHWSSQLPSVGSIQFPMQPLDSSLAGQLSQLPPLMLPHTYSQPSQTPGAGPSSDGSRARSRSTASTSSPSTPISPTNSRAASLMDEASIAEDKRRRNTAASARFRIKKKHKTLALERSVVELEARADDLEREAAELRRENGWLKEMLIMKGRSVRAQASAAASQMDEDEEDEASGNEGEEEEPDVGEGPEDASSNKGKGKEKAS